MQANLLNTQQQYEAISHIVDTLTQCAAYISDTDARKFGTKDINLAIQESKRIQSVLELKLLIENSYVYEGFEPCLGLSNLN